METTA